MMEEQTGKRDPAYSEWHRPRSIGRYLSNPDIAFRLCLIDVDNIIWIEADNETYEPLALIETARDKGQHKSGKIIGNLARRCAPQVAAFNVLYTVGEVRNPYAKQDVPDITAFRIRRLFPNPEQLYRSFNPRQYAEWLVQLRQGLARGLWRSDGFQFGEDS